MDKEGAIDALEIAYSSFKSGDMDKTIRLLNKALRMYPQMNPRDHHTRCPLFSSHSSLSNLIESIPSLFQKQHYQQKSSSASTTTEQQEEQQSNNMRNRRRNQEHLSEEQNSDAKEGIDYTREQAEEVKRILSLEKDYYKVLGIERSSNDVIIKKSYKKMAVRLHPDRNKAPRATDAFKIVSAAYMCLSDSSKRKLYDEYGTEDVHKINEQRNPFAGGGGAGGFGGSPFMYRTSMGGRRHAYQMNDDEVFFDLFSQLFGGQGLAAQMQQGRRHPHRQQQRQFPNREERRAEGNAAGSICSQLLMFIFVVLMFLFQFQWSTARHTETNYRAYYYRPQEGNQDAYFSFKKTSPFYTKERIVTYKEHSLPIYLHSGVQYFPRDLTHDVVIESYKVYLSDECESEQMRLRKSTKRAMRESDPLKREQAINSAQAAPMKMCDRLREWYG